MLDWLKTTLSCYATQLRQRKDLLTENKIRGEKKKAKADWPSGIRYALGTNMLV